MSIESNCDDEKKNAEEKCSDDCKGEHKDSHTSVTTTTMKRGSYTERESKPADHEHEHDEDEEEKTEEGEEKEDKKED